jgi:hypothetical protein
MKRDVRETDLYREAHAIHVSLRRPGTGQISDAAEVYASPDGRHTVFSGTFVDKLEGTPPTRICQVDLTSGDVRVLTFGPNTDRLPKYSPNGRHIAFLSDRLEAGDFQLFLLDPLSGAVRPAASVEGWVEYFHWSPDGRRILLGVAGRGADIAGGQGAVTSKQVAKDAPSWMPAVTSGDEGLLGYPGGFERACGVGVVRLACGDLSLVPLWGQHWAAGDSVLEMYSGIVRIHIGVAHIAPRWRRRGGRFPAPTALERICASPLTAR